MGTNEKDQAQDSEIRRLKACLAELEAKNAGLQEMQRRYECLFDRSLECISVHDLNGKFLDADPAALDLLGVSKSELTSLNILSLLGEYHMPLATAMTEEIIREGSQKHAAEFKLKRREGEYIFVETFAAPLYKGGRAYALLGVAKDVTERKTFEKALQESERNYRALPENANAGILVTSGYQGVITDITQKKLLEQRLIPAERRASTGQLAASIAHEINSPLQAITITLASLRKSLANDQSLQENLDHLRGAFINIREAVKNLLDLNRPGMEGKNPCSINALIEKTVSLLGSQLKQTRVKVNLRLAPGLPPIMGSAQQLGRVFLKLINNAIDAMAGEHSARDEYHHQSSGGTITISTDLISGNIVTAFSDTGPGITAEAFEPLFDPFFTQGKKTGMGIGLSICRSIIEAHKGTISAGNAPGGGAVFMVNLPVEPSQGDAYAWF